MSVKKGVQVGVATGVSGGVLTALGSSVVAAVSGDASDVLSHTVQGLGISFLLGSVVSSGFDMTSKAVKYFSKKPEVEMPSFSLKPMQSPGNVVSGLKSNLMTAVDVVHKTPLYLDRRLTKDVKPIFSNGIESQINSLIHATKNIVKNDGYLQNLLLYGPGGTGKTMIAEYMLKEAGFNYVIMSGGDLAQFVTKGTHVTEVNALFDSMNKSDLPTLIFIDECESLCGDRGQMQKSESIELVNSFLNHTGKPSKKVMVILTTNRLEDLDSAVLNRMDHKINIQPPALEERIKIIHLYLSQLMSESERSSLFNDDLIKEIADKTAGFTGRTIFKMFNVMAGKRSESDANVLDMGMVMDTLDVFVCQEQAVR